MNKRQERYLLSLANFLDNLPKENWDMDRYNPRTPTGLLVDRPQGAKHEIGCGTTCCVAGWAAILHKGAWPKWNPDGGTELDISYETFQDFFGLGENDAHAICSEGMYDSSPQKATQIRKMVEKLTADRDRDV